MNVQETVLLLQQVAKRGFLSEPVTHWLDQDETVQYVEWTTEEKKQMRAFLADNQHLTKMGRHPLGSMFGERESYTLSLLGRLSYAMDGKHIDPSYVSNLANELEESLDRHRNLWEINKLNELAR